MARMRFEETPLAGAWIVDLEPHPDERGFFARAFCEREFEAHGLPVRFPQCNLSRNRRAATLRGMHYAAATQRESKLVRCVRGSIFDVIVDLRSASPTRGAWFGLELSAENGRALFIPAGFAHGFLTLADETDVFYQMGDFFEAGAARGFRYDDPRFPIARPRKPAVISERDATYPDFDWNGHDG
jgi:dTDP-4-dehydrorhamnose 3,5-epimerase